jgi:hypothetical protein
MRNRRVATRLLGGLLTVPLTGVLSAEAKKKKKKKVTLCLNGATIKASKKKKKTFLKKGAMPGPCSAKSCTSNAECGSGAICASGTCQTCSVTCNGDSAACGVALQQRLDQGGTVYVCPGRYVHRFVVGVATIIGAGSGEDPQTNTILDAQDTGRTLSVNNGVTTSLSRLRVTGGQAGGSDGGGFFSKNCDLTITSCAFEGNSAQSGGGVWIEGGRYRLQDVLIENNIATTYSGGGLFVYGGAKGTLENSRVTRNKAIRPPGPILGGGILLESAELTITRSEVSFNTSTDGGGGIAVYGSTGVLTLDSATRVVSNTASGSRGGGGILLISDGKVNLNGATLDLNSPDNLRTI